VDICCGSADEPIPARPLAIKLDGFDDFTQIVRHSDRTIREAGAANAAAAEHFVELFLICRVIGDGCGWVFELMAGQNANDALIRADDALITEQPSTGDARGTRRFAAESARGNFGFRV